MKQITGTIGNYNRDQSLENTIEAHERSGTLERVVIDASQRKRSRLRIETHQGTEIGLVLENPLNDGDVLVANDERAIIVEFKPREAVVLTLPEPTEKALETVISLGHKIGNQHWKLAVEKGKVYVPVQADKHIIENVLEEYLPSGTTIRYEEVNPEKWIESSSTEDTGTSYHIHGEHSHTHTDHTSHSHSHTHTNQHPHSHSTDHQHPNSNEESTDE